MPAEGRDLSLPILFVETLAGNEAALGLDLALDTLYRTALRYLAAALQLSLGD